MNIENKPIREESASRKSLIRPDRNILRWSALFTTSKFKGKSRELHFETTQGSVGVVVGRHTTGKNEVIEIGVLTAIELVSLCTLIEHWEKAGKPEEPIRYGIREFISDSGKISFSHKNYTNAYQSLRNLLNIPVTWNASFKLPSEQGEETLEVLTEMHFLSSLMKVSKVNKRQGKKEVLGFKYRLNEVLMTNMRGSYNRPFNFRVLRELKNELSMLMYCHFDSVMADKRIYTPSGTYLFEQLGLLDSYKYPSDRLKRFKAVQAELIKKPLSTGIINSMEIIPTKNGKDWKVVVKKRSHTSESQIERSAELDYFVNQALEVMGETENEITKKFLYKAGLNPKLGPQVIDKVTHELKADIINNKSAKDKPHFGKWFVSEVHKIAEARGVDL